MAVIIGTPGNDTLTGGIEFDYIVGLDGDDILIGGAGAANQLQGGLGRDVYFVSVAGDTIVEFAGEGTDQVRTALGRFILPANVEELVYTGTGDFNGIGSAGDNLILGAGGNDVLDGGLGADVLNGAAGDDYIIGGDGAANVLIGGTGRDVYYVSAAGDSIVENVGEGNDQVRTALASFTLPANVEELVFIGTGDFVGTGNDSDNVIAGGSGNDTLNGGLGGDVLSGGAGNDTLIGGTGAANTLIGGTGRDIYFVSAAGDSVVEAVGEGNDQVRTTLNRYVAPANIEELVFIGTGDFVGTIGVGGTVLVGGAGNDTLTSSTANVQGGAGNDILYTAQNRAEGGTGNDTYILGNTVRTQTDNIINTRWVIENANEGTDEVITSGSVYWLETDVENLTYVGTGNFEGHGNKIANVITGGPGNDTLYAVGDNFVTGLEDTLIGGAGNDVFFSTIFNYAAVMFGGTGNDTYNIQQSFTLAPNGAYLYGGFGGPATELPNEGIDTVRFSGISYTLPANIENLTLLGGYDSGSTVSGFGNGSDNVIVALDSPIISNYSLSGFDGNDTLRGNNYNDTLNGGNGADQLGGGLGNDSLTGGAGADQFLFDTALNGTSNVDTITDFTAGTDRFLLDRAIFAGIANTGVLSPLAFGTGSVATTGDQRILYDPATGFVRYDADGAAGVAGIVFAQLATGLTLTAADFVVI